MSLSFYATMCKALTGFVMRLLFSSDKAYNAVSDDMREDEETKAELHQQVDDLKERLWSICDDRKEQAEQEREANMNDGWLEDRLGILTNHYLTVMQVGQ